MCNKRSPHNERPHASQLEKDLARQQRPRAVKDKEINNLKSELGLPWQSSGTGGTCRTVQTKIVEKSGLKSSLGWYSDIPLMAK